MNQHHTDSAFPSHIRISPNCLMLILFAAMVIIPIECTWAKTYALVGGTIFTTPHDTPIENGILLIGDDKIVSVGLPDTVDVPADAEIIDASGLYITAGFWNSHVHYIGVLQTVTSKDADQLNDILTNTFLRWGFVNTVDLGSWLRNTLTIKERILNGEVNGPRILTAAPGFAPLGGSPFYIKPTELPELDNLEKTREKVLSSLNAGADATKLFTGSWASMNSLIVMEPDIVRSATDAAHEQGALVFAHPSDSDGARVAIENGVDVLAHVFPAQMNGPWDQTLPAKMASRNVALIPTLKLWRPELTRAGLPSQNITRNVNAAIAQTKACHEAGVTILFGTDVGYLQDTDTTEEFRLMGQAGMDYKDILVSLTTAPAARYKFAETHGRIQKNFEADLVLLGSDPRVDITAYADVVTTIRGGRIVFQR
ncbi:MAG: amidohydrolase family protein [Gammaproteobacteria bacterium]|nr:amidohydrolase family protein [Gammaproteobacteria bacterium]